MSDTSAAPVALPADASDASSAAELEPPPTTAGTPPAIAEPPQARVEADRARNPEPIAGEGPATGTEVPPEAPAAGFTPSLKFGADLELMFLDVDGPGGFRNRDASTIRPSTRSPYVTLYRSLLDVRGRLTPWLTTRVRVKITTDSAKADRAYVEAEPWRDHLIVQLGMNQPIQREERRTQTYSPLGAAFWRSTQYHLAIDLRGQLGPIELRAAPSAAFFRGVGDEYSTNDESLAAMSFIDGEPGESQTLEGGGLASVGAYGATVAGFGFVGKLRDNQDMLYLQSLFEAYDVAGDRDERESYWYGGRVRFERFGAWLQGEVIRAKQGLVEREAFELAGSYTLRLRLGKEIREMEPIARYSGVTITNFPEEYQVPQTWDRTQALVGLLVRPLHGVELKVERLFHGERPGTSREGKTSVENDEWLGMLVMEVWNGTSDSE